MVKKLDRHKTIKEALEYVAANPDAPDKAPLDMEIWEIVARNLFLIANKPDPRIMGSMARATRAQKIIMNRTTGTRRTGTHPAVRSEEKVVFTDLTTAALASKPEEETTTNV
jgi:hypothetical protein